MAAKDGDGLDALLFSESAELVDFKCFRGDRDDITEDDIRREIHSAVVQRKMGRASASSTPPAAGVASMSVRKFVEGLSNPR